MNKDFLYNNKILKDRRKELRNNPTETEAILWGYLKHNRLGGFKFSRQYSAGPYILDFYCHKARLAVELDGSQHQEKENFLYDKDRENYLKSVNIETIRFWNSEVIKNINHVLDQIFSKVSRMGEPPLNIRGGRE